MTTTVKCPECGNEIGANGDHAAGCLVGQRGPTPSQHPKQPSQKNEQAGVVLVFKPGITKERAELLLAVIQHTLVEEPRVHMFNPEHGGPAWYIP